MVEITITEKRKVPACDKCNKRPAAIVATLEFAVLPEVPEEHAVDERLEPFSGKLCAPCAKSAFKNIRTPVRRKRGEATAK